jgi:paraquat-inducible protein A
MNHPVSSPPYHAIPQSRRGYLRVCIILAAALFVAGLISPMLTLSEFIVVTNTFSVVSGIYELFEGGRYFLFLLVGGFSVVLPIFKLYVLFRLTGRFEGEPTRLRRYLHLMHDYGRWAMLDVMVVAILIVTVKLGVVASIEVHYGLYLFGTAVLMMSGITHWIVRLTDARITDEEQAQG